MPTIVTVELGGTGATSAADARNTLGVMANTGGTFSGAINAATANITTIVTGNALTLSTGTASNGNIIFSANGSEDMRITNTGMIGIFTTTPNSNLTIVGNVWATTGINAATINATTSNAATFISSAGINVGAQAINAYGQANTAYTQANNARSDANTTFATINTTFGTVNTSLGTINTNYQAAYAQANTARTTANDAYGAANTRLSASGGTLSGDLIITGNLTVSGNQTILNTEVLTTEDAEIVLLSNTSSTPALNAGLIVNRGTSTNTFLRWDEALDEWGWSDSGTTTYYFEDLRQGLSTHNTTYATINTTFATLNTSAGTQNTAITTANDQANTARGQANTAYGQANLAYAQANSARSDANTTFATVNTTFATINTTTATMNTATSNRVLKAGDTMTGQLNVSSGGLLVTGNVGFGMPSPIFPLQVKTNTGTPPQALQLNTTDWTTTIGSAFQFGFGAATGNTYSEIRALSGGYNAWNNLVLQSGGGNVGIGSTNPGYKLDVSGTLRSTGTAALGTSVAQGDPSSTDITANAYLLLNGVGGNYLSFGQKASNLCQWIQSGYSNPTTAVYPISLNPLGGNVGIGTLTPGQRLEVSGGNISYKPSVGNSVRIGDDESYGTSGTGRYTALGFSSMSNGGNRIFAHNTGEDGIFICAATSRAVVIRAGGSGTDHSVFTSAGNFYTNGYITNIRGNASVSAPSTSDHSLGTRITLYDQSSTAWYAMGIESDTMWFNSDNQYKWYADASQTMLLNSAGNLTIAGTLTENSSASIKENIIPINNALNIVSKLVGVTYDRKDGSAKERAGLIAEEVDQVLPNVVQKDNDGNPSGIQYTNLIAYLVESIKELKAEIDTLKKQNGTVS